VRLSENAIISRIRDLFPGGAALTDDCGQVPVPPPGRILLVTTDLMEDGQHFNRAWHPPALLGRKLLMVNLSDLDASGAEPLGFTLTLALGKDLEAAWVDAFLVGLAEAARETGVPVSILDPAVTGPKEPAQARDSYLRTMRKNLSVLVAALKD